jgi:hypothetical protein
MVSGMTLPYGDPWLQRQNEPSIAVSTRNPMHILAGANDYRTVDIPGSEGELPGNAANSPIAAGDAWLGVFQSMDRGESWTSTMLPGYPQDTSSIGTSSPLYRKYGLTTAAADPVVRAGTNGIFYYAGIVFKRDSIALNGDSALFLARYIDNNNTDGTPPIKYVDTRIIDSVTNASGQFIDKPWIAVDIPNAANQTVPISAPEVPAQTIAANNVYIAYTVFSGSAVANTLKGKILFRSSEDNGLTWSSAVEISSGSDINQGAVIGVDPGTPKKLYVAWRRFKKGSQTDAIMVATSNNGGKNFQKAAAIASITPFDQGSSGATFRSNSYPAMTVDDKSYIHVAWTARGFGPSTDSRIVISSSKDGNSWSTPRVVDNYSGRGHQFMPSLVYTGGKLMMAWYDARNDASKDFSDYIAETQSLTGLRHTVDVRTATASPGSSPTFESSIQVSRYLFALVDNTQNSTTKKIYQVQFNPVNYPLFKGGMQPFHGDYVDLAPSPMFVLKNKKWQFNTDASSTPIYHVAWTDNRDVRPPNNNVWTNYSPPRSFQSGEFPSPSFGSCDPVTAGMRNQNIYTASVTGGITIGTPRNSKPLGGLGTYSKGQIPRTFIVFVKNATSEIKSFRLTIASPPMGGTASFLEFKSLSSLDVSVAPNSEVSRSVFVTSTSQSASVTVQVTEIFYPGGNAISGGFSGSIVINPDDSNPAIPSGDSLAYKEYFDPNIINPNIINPNIINPNIINWDYANPNIINPTITNPNIINPNFFNPNIINPNIINPNIINPDIINPNIINPNIINPNIINPNIINPNIINPNIINPNIINPNIINAADVVWEVENLGNTYSTYTVRTLTSASIPAGIDTQLFIYRIHYTPQTGGTDCTLKQEPHFELVASIPNPNIINPNIINPNIINPNIINPDIENATFYIGPGESAVVDLRVIDPNPSQAKIMANGQMFSLTNFVKTIDFAATSHNVDTTDVAAEETAPTFAATELMIGTQAQLPDGKIGTLYSLTLSASGPGGSLATYTWKLNSGDLPQGLSLSSSGVLSGTPQVVTGVIYPFTYHFVLEVTDGSLKDEEEFFLTIYNTPAPPALSISTTSPLSNAIVDSFYGKTLEAVGGTWPRSWNVVSGSLPAGLTFDTAGAISGIPTTTGTYSFTLQVTDSSAPPQTVSKAFSLTVIPNAGSVTISGTCYSVRGSGLPGVLMHGLPDEPMTDANGHYSASVPSGWSGVVTPFVVGCAFTPESRPYASITTNQTGQDYNALAGAPSKLAFAVQPGNTSVNAIITPAVTVEIQDAAGNKITTATNTVTLSIGTNPGSGTLTGTLSKAAVAGVATFNDLKINAAGTGYTLSAVSEGLTSATSSAFNIIAAGPAAKLAFKVQPSNTAAGVAITPAVTVEIQDAGGNVVGTATDTVTIDFQYNPGGGTLSGTLSKPAVGGIAAFNDLSINNIGIGYTLSATSGSLTAATSNPFNIFSGIDPSAPWITPGVYNNLVISDRDVWFKVNVEGGKDLQVSTSNAVAQQTSNDLDIYLYDAAGNLLTTAFSDKGNETVFLSNVPAGVYFIGIWGSFVNYTLTVATGDFAIGEITGRITNSSGNGVQNALVYLYPENDSSWTALIAIAPTDGAGNYKIAHAPGNYKLLFSWDERILVVPDIYVVGQWYSGKVDFASANIVPIQAGATNSGMDAVLEDGAAISGRVTTTPGGAPISQVLVKAYNAAGGYSSARTDSSGNYTIKHIRIGDGFRKVQFDAQSAGNFLSEWFNDKPSQSAADPVNIAARATTENISAQLGGGGIISGRVTNTTGNGIANVNVSVNDLSNNYVKGGLTDANGYYSAQGLAAGTYKVAFYPPQGSYYVSQWYNGKADQASADPVSVTVGATTGGINAQLAIGGGISGHVGAALGGNIQDVDVEARDLSNNFVRSSRTDTNGNYTILGLPGGTYKIYVNRSGSGNYVPQYYSGKATFDLADQISVTTGATTPNINVTLALGGAISGQVTNGSTGIPNVNVSVNDVNGNFLRNVQTDQTGSYVIGGLSAGTDIYKINFPSTGYYLGQWYNGKPDSNSADKVSVTAGATTSGINAQLTSGGGIISGRVTNGSGQGIQNVSVWPSYLNGNFFGVGGGTDNSGNYTLTLAPGNYKLFFNATVSGVGSYVSEWYNDKATSADADPITVSVGATFTANAQLANGGNITGLVTDSLGTPINNVNVNVNNLSNQWITNGFTQANGTYSIALPAGSFKVAFYPPQGSNYINQFYNNKASFDTGDPVTVTVGVTTPNINAQLATGGIISGTVTNSGGGIANVGIGVNDLSNHWVGGCQTNTDGTYSVTVPAGTYKVGFWAPQGSNYINQWYNNKASFDTGDPVTVTAVVTTPNINAQLATGGIISGTVTNSGGGGIGSVNISVQDTPSHWVQGGQTKTDGTYSVMVPQGSYKVWFGAPQGSYYLSQWYAGKADFTSGDPVTVATNGTTMANVTLVTGGIISGTVTNSGGGIANVNVGVNDLSNHGVQGGQTNTDGTYSVTVPAGTYKVGFWAPQGSNYINQWYNNKASFDTGDPVSVVVNQVTQNINAALATGGIISGTVTNSGGGGIGSVNISVQDTPSHWVQGGQTKTDGTYSVMVPQGSYKVWFGAPQGSYYLSQWYNNKASFETGDPVNVATNGTTTANVTLVTGGIISGTVTNSGGGIANVGIGVNDLSNHGVQGCQTNTDGTYSVAVPAGTYKVGFWAPQGSNYINQWYNNKASFDTGDPVTVTTNATSTANATLVLGGLISGHVGRSPSGDVQNVDVQVKDLSNNFIWSMRTDANGNYSVPVPGGTYKVFFDPSPSGGNYVAQWYNGKTDFVSADQVPVTAGITTSGINATLSASPTTFTISGTVTLGGLGLADVVMNGLPGTPMTNTSGYYTATVNSGWSGVVTPTKTGLTFSPISQSYSNVTSNQTQNYTVMSLTHKVSGTVYYSTTPLVGVTVKLGTGQPTSPPLQTMATDTSGHYSFSGVADGAYWVRADGPSAEYIGWCANSIQVAGSDVTQDIDLPKKMTLLTPASGSNVSDTKPTLTWQANPQAARYTVQLNVTSSWEQIGQWTGITSPSFQVPTALTVGTNYTWLVDAYDSVNHRVGATETAFTFTLIGGYTVSGTIYYSTTGLSGVAVKLYSSPPAEPPIQQTTTNTSGQYSFSSVANGSYEVEEVGPTPEYVGGIWQPIQVSGANLTHDMDLPKKITLVSPPNASTVTVLRPTLTWLANPQASRYFIQVSKTSPWQDVEIGSSTTPSYTLTTDLTPGTNYTWHIGAYDAANHNVGDSVDSFTFTVAVAVAIPEINLRQGETNIADGGSYDYGSHVIGTNTGITFTIENTGTANLTLNGSPIITITGANANQFSVLQQPSTPVAPSSSTTFIIRFSPTSAGIKTASISILNDDADENPYDLTITGAGSESYSLLTTYQTPAGVNIELGGGKGIDLDSSGNIYFTDCYLGGGPGMIYRFNPVGDYLGAWDLGRMEAIYGFAIDVLHSNEIYYSNQYYISPDLLYKVFRYSGGSWGSNGSGDGQFNVPIDLCCDETGYVYVLDKNNHRVQKFTPTGGFVTKWGTQGTGDGQFNSPIGIACDGTHIYVSDTENNRIQVFDTNGGFVRKWGSMGSGWGQFYSPGNIAFCREAGPNQGLYVLDRGNSRVLKFSSEGDFLAAWQPSNYPKAIAANNSGVYGLRSISQTGYIDVYRKD